MIKPTRDTRAQRSYSEEDYQRLAQIIKWTKQGFTLTEIKEALKNGQFSREAVEAQITHLRLRHAELAAAIIELEQNLTGLTKAQTAAA